MPSCIPVLGRSVPAAGSVLRQCTRSYSQKSARSRLTSTSALDHKLAHPHRTLPPLPGLDRPSIDPVHAVSNILYNTPPPSSEPIKRHTLNMFVQDEPGVLARVSGCLAARGVNIDSLVVCATDVQDLSRMCIVLRGQDGTIEQVRRQLEDLVPVWAVVDYTNTKVVERELMLVKVSILGPDYFEQDYVGFRAAEAEVDHAVKEAEGADAQPASPALSPSEALAIKNDNMRSITALAGQFGGRIVDISDSSMMVEVAAKTSRLDAFFKLVRPFGILECTRTGTMVLPRTPIKSTWSAPSDLENDDSVVFDATMLPPG
ncbi:acetolactate synthase [Malassezia psittaci]|uniref:Acetolactate synthase n=1 Tax=Malassezia psittaci TaxID=1821823 RepID=A0AAF0JEZ8_9BASI|nr:acetolactate synthase [Malassezia psittaci]